MPSLKSIYLTIVLLCSASVQAQTTDLSDLIVGNWYKKSQTNKDGVNITTMYVQEFLPDGTISEQTQYLISYQTIQASCIKNTSWEWYAEGNMLYQKRLNNVVTPDFLKENGIKIYDDQKLNNVCNIIRKDADETKLLTSSFRVLSIDQTKVDYQYKDDNGNWITTTDYKVPQRFGYFRVR